MIEPQTTTIEGVTFTVTPLRLKKSREVFLRLTKRVAPGLGALLDALASGGGSLMDSDAGKIGGALEALVGPLSDEDLDWISDAFGETTTFSTDGEKTPYLTAANRESLFQGRLVLFFRWIAYCIEVNYADFFALLRERETADQ